MRQLTHRSLFLSGVMMTTISLAFALQSGVTRGPVVELRNPALEKESQHHLNVARFYMKKKNWVAARTRLQEIVAQNPDFSDIAEVYFLLGKVYTKTNEIGLAQELYSRVVEEFPHSELAEKAREELQKLPKQEEKSNGTDDH